MTKRVCAQAVTDETCRGIGTDAVVLMMLNLRRLDFKRQQIGNIPALTLPVGR